MDGNEVIINKETPEQRVEDWEFAAGDVLVLDVFVSSGDGMGREHDSRTTVFKREMDKQYSLKSKSSRSFFSEMNTRLIPIKNFWPMESSMLQLPVLAVR